MTEPLYDAEAALAALNKVLEIARAELHSNKRHDNGRDLTAIQRINLQQFVMQWQNATAADLVRAMMERTDE